MATSTTSTQRFSHASESTLGSFCRAGWRPIELLPGRSARVRREAAAGVERRITAVSRFTGGLRLTRSQRPRGYDSLLPTPNSPVQYVHGLLLRAINAGAGEGAGWLHGSADPDARGLRG